MLESGHISPPYRKLHTPWQHRLALSVVVTSIQPEPKSGRRARSTVLALAVLVALVSLAGCWSAAASSAPPASPSAVKTQSAVSPGPPGRLQASRSSRVGIADGKVPEGVTVFDNAYPAVAKLDPALLAALRSAARDAGADGVEFEVNSGWRSKKYQEQLFAQAVSKYGSDAEAARWVARPGTSAHEAGKAVDVGPGDADAWLSRHGAAYGLCQIYRNEAWHYELRPDAVDHGCPAMYADPTHDPRMQQ